MVTQIKTVNMQISLSAWIKFKVERSIFIEIKQFA